MVWDGCGAFLEPGNGECLAWTSTFDCKDGMAVDTLVYVYDSWSEHCWHYASLAFSVLGVSEGA